jgi:RNA polymerase sigma-70 factor (ECF subfamily)
MSVSGDGNKIIRDIYNKFHKVMLRTAKYYLDSARAEDAVHDVFVKLIEKFENNIEELGDKPGAYFVIVVRNHSLNLLKQEKTGVISFEEEEEDGAIFQSPAEGPEDALLKHESDDRLASLLRRLKPAARQLIEYKYIEEYSNIEIAKLMGISETAVSTRLGKIKKRLKQILEDEGEFDDTN